MSFVFKNIEDKARLTSIATDMIATAILAQHKDEGSARLMLSGGSTPGPIYENLSQLALPWTDVQIGLVDERWVDEADPGSNAALVRRTLIQKQASSARLLAMKSDHAHAAAGQVEIEARYASISQPYCATILGMGPDGHTASWFPDADGLSQAIDTRNKNCVQAITAKKSNVTGEYLERMTLTRSAINQSNLVILLISGPEKLAVFEEAASNAASPHPVRAAIDALGGRLTVLYTP